MAAGLFGGAYAAAPSAGATAAPALATKAQLAPVDSKKTLEGILRFLTADTVEHVAKGSHEWHGKSEDHAQPVLVAGDKTYFLKGKKAQIAQANRRVRVVGAVSGKNLEVEKVTDLGAAPGAVSTSGTTRVLVMLAHWNTPDSVTPASAHNQMFTDSNGWYRDASYTALGQTGDTTPWMRISGPVDGKCYGDHRNTMNQAKNAAVALGYTLSNYDNFVLYSPNNSWQTGSDCSGYAGWAYVGAQNTWLNGYMDRRVTVHEEGHNYGLWHAHSHMCSGGGTTGTCSWLDYGDSYDAMGSSGTVGHFNAGHKDQLGWMAGRKVDLTAGGSATLAPLASDALNVKAAFARVSSSRVYWVEYRQTLDYDSAIPSYGTDGVMIRAEDPSVGGDSGTNLLDVVPSDGISVNSVTLAPGQSWTSAEGWTFTTNSASATGAGITVTAGDGPVCADSAYEPDDTAAQAGPLTQGQTQNRAFCVTNDQDWVKFAASAGISYRMETLNIASSDTVLDLYGTNGSTLIASNDDSNGTLASQIVFSPTVSGTYYLRATEFSGLSGDALTYDLRITSEGGGDTTPPTVTTRSPAADATGVNGTANVTATFSEEVNGVSGSTFTLANASTGAAVSAVVSRNGTTNQWILNPGVTLSSGTRYTATLSGGPSAIRDLAGNALATSSWSFAISNGSAPTITARTPGVDATNASRTGNVTATFNKEVTGVSSSTFTLRNASSGALISSIVSRNGTTNQWILDPSLRLANDTRYTVTLTGGTTAIRDLAGNPLATTSWTFLSGPRPIISTRTPASGATAVSRTANATVTLSEAANGVSATTFTLRNTATGAVISSGVTRNGTTNQWILNPGVTLAANTGYTVRLTGGTTGIRDLAGNPLATTSWRFTTGS